MRAQSAERLESARTAGLCFACLKKGHIARYCEVSEKCRKDGCACMHHMLLPEAWASTQSGNKELPKELACLLDLAYNPSWCDGRNTDA